MYISRRGWVQITGAIICALFASVYSATTTSATNFWLQEDLTVTEWSQFETEPKERYNVSVSCEMREITYYDPYKLREIESTACVHDSKSFSLTRVTLCQILNGSICKNDNWTFIALNGQNTFYKIDNLLSGTHDDCWQTSPSSNRIVFTCNGNFTIVENIFQNLRRQTYPVSGNTYFEFDQSGYSTITLNGRILWDLRGAVVSRDMEWAAIALRDIGVMRVNLTDFTTQLVTNRIGKMNVGSDPLFHFALTENGKTLAIGGMNTIPAIYHISESCGLTSDAIESSWYELADFEECDFVHTGPILMDAAGGPSAGFRYWRYLKFSDDETQLSGLFVPFRGIPGSISGWVNINTGEYDPVERLEYLALGDSYTSGEGDYSITGSHGNFLPFTDVAGPPEERCHLSERSYPYLLRDLYEIDSNAMRSVACSGAKTTDIVSTKIIYHGQNDRLKNFAKEGEYKYDALYTSFIPGRVEQIEFVRKYKPHVITVGIGGNDADFADELNKCVDFFFTHCGAANEDGAERQRVGRLILNNYDKLRRLYRDLKEASPQTTIFAVGYPKFINDKDASCFLNGAFVNESERIFISNAVEFMNEVIESAAISEGVNFVDIEDSLLGGRLCEGITEDYVTGMRNQLWLLSLRSDQRAYLYHPNPAGHRKIAETIHGSLDTLVGAANPTPFKSMPEANDYFKSTSLNDKRVVNTEFLPTFVVKQGQTLQSQFGSGTFSQTPTTITMFSVPRQLGTAVPNSDGSLVSAITIPDDMPVGYHTIVFSGADFASNPLDVVQSVFVMNDDANDIDDDSTLDTKDNCFFWLSCGENTTDNSKDSSGNGDSTTRSAVESDLGRAESAPVQPRLVYVNDDSDRSSSHKSSDPDLLDGEGVLGTRHNTSAKKSVSDPNIVWYGAAFSTILLMIVVGLIIKLKKG